MSNCLECLQQNKLKEAEFHFKAILNSNPENGEALFGLGRIALRLERYDAGVYLLQKACERLPHMLEPLHALADAFNGVHSPNDALTVLEYAKKLASHFWPGPLTLILKKFGFIEGKERLFNIRKGIIY